jgi:hypothetical protein
MNEWEKELLKKDDLLKSKGVNEGLIKEAEKKLQLKFASDYREYLLTYGIAAYDGHELTGLKSNNYTNVVGSTLKLSSKLKLPKDWYLIEDTNMDGILIWQDSSGKIYSTRPGNSPKYIAHSLAEYIRKY